MVKFLSVVVFSLSFLFGYKDSSKLQYFIKYSLNPATFLFVSFYNSD